KSVQANFEANFSRMFVDVLKFLCYELGVSETGSKQDLVNRLVSESKRREVSDEYNTGKGKVSDGNDGTTAAMFGGSDVSDCELKNAPTSSATEKRFDGGRFSYNLMGNDQPQHISWASNKAPWPSELEDNIWKRRELSKARNQ
ncbi:15618_t:CDS:1, partial [Cetraspora pellucida]